MKTRISRFEFGIILIAIFWLSTTTWAGSPPQSVDAKDETENDQAFFAFLVDDALDFDYFLSELNIIEDQRNQLKQIGEQGLKTWLALQADLMKNQVGQKPGPPPPGYVNPVHTFQKELAGKIGEVLLPHQLKQLRRLLKQRTQHQMFGFEGFELVTRSNLKLEMSSADNAKLRQTSKQVSEEFSREKQKLAQQTWDKIKLEMPAKSTEGLTELMSLLSAERQARLRGEQVSFSDLKTWTKDDYANYETRSFQDMVYSLMRSEALRERLGILEFQTQQMIDINGRGRKNVPSGTTPEDREKMIAMAAAGDVEGMKAIYKKQRNAELRARQVVIDEIAKDVLLPKQVSLIKSVAKFKRLIHESKYGDEFGAAVAWSKSFSGPDFDSAGLKKLVGSARKQYYIDLKKLRKTAWDKMVEALPEQSRKKFESEYGQFYDYQSEKIASWDSLRKESK